MANQEDSNNTINTGAKSNHNLPQQPLYQAEVDDEIFDDACDVGQFFLNPTWYLYVKLRGKFRAFSREQTNLRSVQAQDTKRSNYLHLQRPLYFVFLIGGWTAVFLKLYPRLWASDKVSELHPKIGFLVFSTCLASWKLAASVGPGTITAETAWKFANYPYDNLLYQENAICPTLQQRKLARSKYDRYTHQHVPRFDHFCGWLHKPIGEENYRFFLLFVGIHAGMCLYGTYVIGSLVLRESEVLLPTDNDDEAQKAFYLLPRLLSWILRSAWNDLGLSLIGMFLCAAALPLWSFFGFHLSLVVKGMTTNEHYKWKLIRKRHKAAVEQFHQQRTGDHPGPCPKNVYDLGVFSNTWEVLHPRSLRHHAPKDD